MTAYRATFQNGTTRELKNSKQTYTHAWKLSWTNWEGKPTDWCGFAGSQDKAQKAARSALGTSFKGIPVEIEIVEVEGR